MAVLDVTAMGARAVGAKAVQAAARDVVPPADAVPGAVTQAGVRQDSNVTTRLTITPAR
jgi:hypothetical protein